MARWDRRRRKKAAIIGAVCFAVCGLTAAAIAIVAALSQDSSSFAAPGIQVASGNAVQLIDDSDSGFGKKKVSFYSSDENNADLFLRIAYGETWIDEETGEYKSNTVNGAEVVSKSWTNAFYDDFVDGGDGWYYYKKILKPLDSVQVITATALTVPEYAYYSYDLSFRFETVKAMPSAAQELWARTATVTEATGAVAWEF